MTVELAVKLSKQTGTDELGTPVLLYNTDFSGLSRHSIVFSLIRPRTPNSCPVTGISSNAPNFPDYLLPSFPVNFASILS